MRDPLFHDMRSDQSNVFGGERLWVNYPKASLSWLLSDESFFPLNLLARQFRARTAYGASGAAEFASGFHFAPITSNQRDRRGRQNRHPRSQGSSGIKSTDFKKPNGRRSSRPGSMRACSRTGSVSS
jgi:hypothetical protein